MAYKNYNITPCTTSCAVSAVFLIGMIYMMYATSVNGIVNNYQNTLTPEQLIIYEKIVTERSRNYYFGFFLGLILAILFIIYNNQIREVPFSAMPLVCIVVAISFLTSYFYYVLSPKTTYMLDHLKTPEETKAWVKMYRGMQLYYHGGLVLGLVAVGFMAFAFRC